MLKSGFYIYEKMCHVWLVALNMMIYSSIHSPESVIPFFFTAEESSIVTSITFWSSVNLLMGI